MYGLEKLTNLIDF